MEDQKVTISTGTKSQSKFDDARALRDSLRFNELRQKRGTDRSAEENREYARLYARNRRKAEREGVKPVQISKKALSKISSVEEFWNLNRSMADGKRIHAYLQIQERYLDELHWLNRGWELPPDDEDFVGLDEGVQCMNEFITERGMIHDDVYDSPFLQDWLPAWGVWQDKMDYIDPIWKRVQPFWLDQERFHALCSESEATKIYARYGIRTALPQYHVRLWRGRISAHKHCRTQGLEHNDPKCWLCNHERLHGAKEKQSEKTTHDYA